MKHTLLIFFCFILAGAGIVYLLSYADKKIDQENFSYTSKLGTKYVLDKDTLTIVDYSIWNNSFRLSNGKTISKSLIK